MELRGIQPQHLVICGGAALRALGLVSRVTRDVDILAARGEVDGEVRPAWPLSDEIREAAAEVAVELSLPDHWLSAATSLLIGALETLPPEIWSGLHEVSYGSRLRVSYVGRAGLLHLKFRAVAGRDESRDVDDILAMSPSAVECRRAIRWLEAQEMLDAVGKARVEAVVRRLADD